MDLASCNFDTPDRAVLFIDPGKLIGIPRFQLATQRYRIVIVDDLQRIAGSSVSIMEKIVACRVIGGMVRTSMTGFAETGSIGIIIFPAVIVER